MNLSLPLRAKATALVDSDQAANQRKPCARWRRLSSRMLRLIQRFRKSVHEAR